MSAYLSPEIIRLLLVLAATIAAHFIAKLLLQRAEKIAARTDNNWDDALIAAARKPLSVLIWLSGIALALHLLHRQTGEEMLEFAAPARSIGAVLCVAWFLFKLIRGYADNLVAKRIRAGEEIDRTTVDGLSKVARITVFVIAALTIIQTLGFSISGVMAFGGMGGIAVGFAAKDLLANFFGGLMIHLDRPFNVGDKIRSPDQQIEGWVEYIGWRQTVVRSLEMTPLYIPNSLFTSIVVENATRLSHRRILETIGLRYDDMAKMEIIVADIKAMLYAHPDIDSAQQTIVAFNQFADSSLNILIQAFSPTANQVKFHDIKQDVMLKIAAIVAGHGAQMAFPTRTLYLNQPPA